MAELAVHPGTPVSSTAVDTQYEDLCLLYTSDAADE